MPILTAWISNSHKFGIGILLELPLIELDVVFELHPACLLQLRDKWAPACTLLRKGGKKKKRRIMNKSAFKILIFSPCVHPFNNFLVATGSMRSYKITTGDLCLSMRVHSMVGMSHCHTMLIMRRIRWFVIDLEVRRVFWSFIFISMHNRCQKNDHNILFIKQKGPPDQPSINQY